MPSLLPITAYRKSLLHGVVFFYYFINKHFMVDTKDKISLLDPVFLFSFYKIL